MVREEATVIPANPYVAASAGSAVHRRAGGPPRSPDPTDLAEERSERRSRSLEEPLDLRLLRRLPFPLVEVRNPLHRTAYLVMAPTFPEMSTALCTCADFARRGLGTCKHIEAADRWLVHHPDTAPPPPGPLGRSPAAVWKEVDRRVERISSSSRPASRKWREPGAALFETSAAPERG